MRIKTQGFISDSNKPAVLVVGCGYLGMRILRAFVGRNFPVFGTARREEQLAKISAAGAEAIHLDLDLPSTSKDWHKPFAGNTASGPIICYLAPPANIGRVDFRLAHFLDIIRARTSRLIYASTTGVYGDSGGSLVDEETLPAPESDRAVRRLAAEHSVRAWAEQTGRSFCILRIPAIYGPGRLPLAKLTAKIPIVDPLLAPPGNRIHVDDLANACVAAALAPRADRRVYNVTDGTWESHSGFLLRLARLAGLPPPSCLPPSAESPVTEQASLSRNGSRRVDNRRIQLELGVLPQYSDLDAGIRASLDAARSGYQTPTASLMIPGGITDLQSRRAPDGAAYKRQGDP